MIKLSFLIFSLFSSTVFSCAVELHSYIYKTDSKVSLPEIAKLGSDCTQEQKVELEGFLTSFKGRVRAAYLKDLIGATSIVPEDIEVIDVAKKISASLNKAHFKLQNIKLLFHQKTIVSNQPITIVCADCRKAGEHQFYMKGKRTLWGKAKILMKTAVLVATKNIQSFSDEFKARHFNLEERWVLNPEELHTVKANLEYFKNNRNLQIGDALLKKILLPKNIVHSGKKVEVTLLSDKVKIVTSAVAKGSAHLNENVIVENKKTKKKYTAKVIGYNKVKVDL